MNTNRYQSNATASSETAEAVAESVGDHEMSASTSATYIY